MLEGMNCSRCSWSAIDLQTRLGHLATFLRYAATSIVGTLMGITSVIWVALRNETVVQSRLCWLYVLGPTPSIDVRLT